MYDPEKNKTKVKIAEYNVFRKTPDKFPKLKLAKANNKK
tara:strand:- start:76887 stop:77003 length:117 start_codon:yes stop_codon:yes gene_type:complete